MIRHTSNEKYYFRHKDKTIELIKNDLLSPESFILKTETNKVNRSSGTAGKFIKLFSPVVSLALSLLTVSNLGFSLFSGIFDAIQFSLVSLFIVIAYIIPVSIGMVFVSALILVFQEKKEKSTNHSSFVSISEEVQSYIELFDSERIHEYSLIYRDIAEKQKEADDFSSLVKKSRKNFAFRKEAEERSEMLRKEIQELKNMAEKVLIDEVNRIVCVQEEKKIQEAVDYKLEVEKLSQEQEKRVRAKDRAVESQILFELASDGIKDISDRNKHTL